MISRFATGFLLAGLFALGGCNIAEDMKMKNAAKEAVLGRFTDPSRVKVVSVEVLRTGNSGAATTVCGSLTVRDAFGGTSEPVHFVRITDGPVILDTDHGGYGKGNVDYLCTGSTTDAATAKVAANTEAMIRDLEK